MKLFIKPGAGSFAPHIVLHELGIAHEIEAVDTKAGKTASGADFSALNPKGYIPALLLDDGTLLTEGAAILQYLADLKPELQLAPANGTLPRYQMQAWLNFIGTELHKYVTPFFFPGASDDWKSVARSCLERRCAYINQELQNRPYLMGEQFTVADAYLFNVLNWFRFLKIDLAQWPNVAAFHARVAERPSVATALTAEGLKR